MKKLLTLIIVVCSVMTTLGQYSAGLRTGINFSNVGGKWNSDDDSKSSMTIGPVVAGVGQYDFSDVFSLNAELGYMTMGQKLTSTYEGDARAIDAVTYIERWRFNCIMMALFTRAMFGGPLISTFIYLGPCFIRKFGGILVVDDGTNSSQSNVVWGPWPSRESSDDFYVDPEYNRRCDLRMCLGAGAGKDLGPGRLELDLRFGFGLLDLNKFDSKEDKQDAKDKGYKPYRSFNIGLTLAYMYDFNKK